MEEEQDVQEIVTPEEVVEEHAPSNAVPYDRFAKEVAKRKALEEQLAALKPKEPELKAPEPAQQFDTLAENLSALRNLDDDEITELRTRAKELGADPIVFAKSPVWKTHLDHLRVNKRAEEKTPAPSKRTAVYEGKTFAEVVAGEDSPEAKKAAFLAQRDAILNRGRNQMI